MVNNYWLFMCGQSPRCKCRKEHLDLTSLGENSDLAAAVRCLNAGYLKG